MIARRLLVLLAVTVSTHLLAVWALPRVVMHRVTQTVAAGAASAPGHVLRPPLPDARSRQVVMPSPDLLYALCVIDVAARPLRVQADPRWPPYWSIAVYAANSDNVFVLNDRQAGGRPVDLWLTHGPVPQVPPPPGATALPLPGPRALLLMRVLVPDASRDLAAADAARATLRCRER